MENVISLNRYHSNRFFVSFQEVLHGSASKTVSLNRHSSALDDTSRHRMRLSASRQQLLVRKRPGSSWKLTLTASLPTGMMRS